MVIVIEVVSSKVVGLMEEVTVCCWAKTATDNKKNIVSKVFFS
jgi:hypothetical protein